METGLSQLSSNENRLSQQTHTLSNTHPQIHWEILHAESPNMQLNPQIHIHADLKEPGAHKPKYHIWVELGNAMQSW